MPMPVIQGGNQPYVFALRTYNCEIHGLRIVGGEVAIDANILPSGSPTSHMAEVMECELTGQTIAGVRAHGTGLAESMVMLMHCELSNMPTGFLIEDIILETAAARVTERGGRSDDRRSEAAMEDRKKAGYF